jgi:hypothetical protein
MQNYLHLSFIFKYGIFVEKGSVARAIGEREAILFIFAGASAEFELNKAVIFTKEIKA